ncbi:hypothetical protein [Nocardioides sp. SYSU D00038]|uniref:hypothetical protein n=1 Tax=Nocardioides sp. SYSU D00038 TaxID=2812554 RepID=UPI001967F939|nr:hypothetical protein [Nocardioides sp. SYSU D00038]
MTAYDDLSSTSDMLADCRATETNLRLERTAWRAVRPAPSIHFDEVPTDLPKGEIEISDAALRLANALSLHLD